MNKQPTIIPFEEQIKNLKRLKWFFLVFCILFIANILLINQMNHYSKEEEQFFDLVEQDDVLDLEHPVYSLSELPNLNEEIPFIKANITKALKLDHPATFLISKERLNKGFDDEQKEALNTLLERGHMLMFSGIDIEAEKVASLFLPNDVPVVPLKGTKPVYFHGYGASYSVEADQIIPTFYASTNSDEITIEDFKKTLNKTQADMVDNLRN